MADNMAVEVADTVVAGAAGEMVAGVGMVPAATNNTTERSTTIVVEGRGVVTTTTGHPSSIVVDLPWEVGIGGSPRIRLKRLPGSPPSAGGDGAIFCTFKFKVNLDVFKSLCVNLMS